MEEEDDIWDAVAHYRKEHPETNNMDFSRNEALEMNYECQAVAFRAIADFIEKLNLSSVESAQLLREAADIVEAQSIVISFRDSDLLKIKKDKH